MWYFVGFKTLVISMSMEWGAHGREEKSYTPGIFAHRLYKISPPPMLFPTLFVEMTFLYLYLINYFKTGRFIKPAGLL